MPTNILSRWICFAILGVGLVWADHADAAGPPLVTVASSYGPGASPINGVSMGYTISFPTINDWGEVAFRSEEYILGEGYYVPTAWSVSDSGEIRRVVQRGIIAPGAEPFPFDSFGYMSGNANDQSAFYGLLNDGDNDPYKFNAGLWATNSQGEIRPIARLGQPAIGTNKVYSRPFDLSFSTFNFVTSRLGQVAFMAETVDPLGIDLHQNGIWAEDASNQLRLVALDNAPVAGASDGATFRLMRSNSLEVSDQGQVSFLAHFSGPDTYDPWEIGLWRQNTDATMHKVLSSGDSLPGWESTRYLHYLHRFNMNNRGDAVIFGSSRESPEPFLVDLKEGFWLKDHAGTTTLLAMEDGPVPGIDSARFGRSAKWVNKEALINGQGDLAFMAKFYGPGITEENDSALWLRRADGDLQMVAREGDLTPNGTMFHSFQPGSTSFSLSNSGQIVFLQSSFEALWAVDQKNQIVLIAEVGQSVDVLDGPGVDLRTLETIQMLSGTGGEDGGRSSFNDRGQIVFFSRTGNFSGTVFLSNAIAVPEPIGCALFCGFLLELVISRKARRG